MQVLESEKKLGEVIPNIAKLLERNVAIFGERKIYCEKKNENYEQISWKKFCEDVLNIAFNLKKYGFEKGDKVAVYSPNRLEMLELELAVMASGGISVPLFAYFKQETAERLINHSDAKFLAVAGEFQLNQIKYIPQIRKIFVFDETITPKGFRTLSGFSELLKERTDKNFSLHFDADANDICLNMYTSGTMGTPKCVQLSHKNILSQQAALKHEWKLNETDRFLSYLPWHHSFGGIFERFSALYNGATIFLESGYGKDPKVIMENWKIVKPTVFFSVPKVFQSLVELAKENSEAEKLFFHSGLKFIFTAAAPLPENLSDEFEKRKIAVIEGWGLTETSPCCTLTNPKIKRETGVVGKPIAGVSIRISGENEIQVKGPNVMCGYYKNDEANKEAITDDGWFRTGDVGEIVPSGLKLIARKDRIFKLSNGEKIIPAELENIIQAKCHYIAFALLAGSGREQPVALLFPNKKLLKNPDYEITPADGCFCPRSLNELAKCLHGCLNDANCGIGQKFGRIKSAILIDDELSVEKNTLTPSLKVAPNNVLNIYKAHIENLYASPANCEKEKNKLGENVYVIHLKK